MSQRSFNQVAGTIFGLVAALHALRLLFGWEAVIGGWAVPQWVSVVALVVAGALAVAAFRLTTGAGR